MTVRLADAYGFCWGVERAVQMAYEARRAYPDRKLHVTNEIIHNPSVNQVGRFVAGHPLASQPLLLPCNRPTQAVHVRVPVLGIACNRSGAMHHLFYASVCMSHRRGQQD